MHLQRTSTLLLLAALVGGVWGLPVKGGAEKGTEKKTDGWKQPKDLDWSVTTGRLIPVSEATDDLPTPGYKMLDLQQRVPVGFKQISIVQQKQLSSASENELQIEKNNSQERAKEEHPEAENKTEEGRRVTEKTSIEEPKQESQNNSGDTLEAQEKVKEASHQNDTIQVNSSTTLNSEENSSELSSQFPTTSSITVNSQEKVPVEEESIYKVVLPEICSITGIGCRDTPKKISGESMDTHNEENHETTTYTQTESSVKFVEQNSERIDPIVNSIAANSTEASAKDTTVVTTYDHQSEKISTSTDSNVQSTEKNGSSNESADDNESSESEESSIQEGFPSKDNLSLLNDYQNIQSEVQLKEQHNFKSIQEKESPEKHLPQDEEEYERAVVPLPQNSRVVTNDDSEPSESDIQKGEKPVIYKKIEESKEDSSEEEEHKAGNYLNKSQRRLDSSKEEEYENTTLTENSTKNTSDISSIEQDKQKPENSTSEEEKKLMTEVESDLSRQNDEPLSESPSIGQRISNYWNAATEYVSKVLNI